MKLRIKQARPVCLNDAIRHAVKLEAFNRPERSKSDGHVSAVATDGSKPTKQIDEHQKMVDMLERRLMKCMGAVETPQPRYGSESKNMGRRFYTCGSKFHLRMQCPGNGRGTCDEEKTTSGKPSVSDSNVTMRERPSLKPTLKPSLRPSCSH
ncbi:hypothetical protein DPMN_017603 [Dreissena polymorpha]|uniref:Uncharacterized protein n=1 Tax=Dreissena polymorpha TaxID=45954 RepID=A0A9D4NFN9_DREPO|nr:hypothetical protein DPMN_017603 [Dreissena polymorpha]